MGLVNVRDNGGLLVASTTTYAIASCAERCLTGLLKSSDAVPAKLSLSVECGVLKAMFENRCSQLFPGAQEHMFQPRANECHCVVLLKLVV